MTPVTLLVPPAGGYISRVSSRQTRNFGFGQSSQSHLRLRHRPQNTAGPLHASVVSEGPRKALSSLPLSLLRSKARGSPSGGEPVRRDNSPLDSHLFPSHPCAWPGRAESLPRPFRPNFAFFASLSCTARKSGVRHPWRTRSPGRGFTGSPPFIRLAPRRSARRKAPKKYQHKTQLFGCAPYGTAPRLYSGLGLTNGDQKKQSNSLPLNGGGLGRGCSN